MAFGRFFKSLVNSEVMGEEIVRSIIHLYEQTARYNPGDSTYDLLLKTYLARLRARRINIDDERVVLSAMADIQFPAQLPEGKNIKALALYCLFKERPDIIEAYPKFAAEYERLMGPILEPSNFDDGNDDPLENRKTTPKADQEIESKKIRFVCSSCRSVSKIPAGIKGIVTCPKCSSTTMVEKDGTSAQKPIDKLAFDEAANRYKKQKEENQQQKARLKENSKTVLAPPAPSLSPSEDERAARLAWLKENAEVFERRKAKGRVLNDYEQGLIDRYQAMLKEENERSSIERNIAETDHPNTAGNEASVEKQWNKNDSFQPNKPLKGINPIAVVGIGGCGCNSVENLATTEMLGIDFLSVDKWFESKSTALNVAKITIGPDDPNTENMKHLAKFISGRKHVVFIVGLGGNFGTLMLQEVANAMGNISGSTAHLVATLPFAFEGAERSTKAEKALARSVAAFSQVLVLKNQELFALADEKTTFAEAFRLSDGKIAQYLLQLG